MWLAGCQTRVAVSSNRSGDAHAQIGPETSARSCCSNASTKGGATSVFFWAARLRRQVARAAPLPRPTLPASACTRLVLVGTRRLTLSRRRQGDRPAAAAAEAASAAVRHADFEVPALRRNAASAQHRPGPRSSASCIAAVFIGSAVVNGERRRRTVPVPLSRPPPIQSASHRTFYESPLDVRRIIHVLSICRHRFTVYLSPKLDTV
jgi:hypothetical protein